jgi:hypothetical protein
MISGTRLAFSPPMVSIVPGSSLLAKCGPKMKSLGFFQRECSAIKGASSIDAGLD